ncbi:MAG: bifunctional (p)ppGpp synthetase/guanosine-3',5'-bis(diphosphate) 3'-pyrophosphohydrolase [Bacilli bacterium]|nr:bifunctional (p)ppGpp synthetase/guanosine-3',5'-bis(diphosphate) 3'-pyrophosphohydrolase [Bacilli bacterium]
MNKQINKTIDDIIAKYREYSNNKKEIDLINKAYEFIKTKELDNKEINHSLRVADILLDLEVDYTTIVAAILHKTIVSEISTVEELTEVFNEDIANLVNIITKINHVELKDNKEDSAIYLRKVIVGMSEDVRALFIKLADRLDSMRSLFNSKDDKLKKKKANETMSVLIPIAHRLGINKIKSELEDLCLRYTKPDVYNDILEKLNNSRDEMNNILQEMQDSISEILSENGIKFKIKSRVKSVYSIYKKLTTGRKWSDIYDILALRVFVEKESECYLSVGLIHSKYRPIPKRFKDYIAMPKENMYQSLHTSVFGVEGKVFEVQIRTYEMDEIAEKGIASHWSYKEKGTKKTQALMEQKLELFRNVMESSLDNDLAVNVNNELLTEMIYVFTPNGDVVELPKGSTPIDFAYRIHSKVGDTTVNALVNGNIVTLDYELNNNDIVNIQTKKDATPNKDWLNFVKTTHARNKIRTYFNKQERLTYIERGKEIFEKEIKKKRLVIGEILTNDNVAKILKTLNLQDLDEIYFNIGSLRYTAAYIISIVTEEEKSPIDVLISKITSVKTEKTNYKNDVIVSGIGDVEVTLAKCCNPIKGDDIIGYITKGRGITIHKSSCGNVINKNERLIDVLWNPNSINNYHAIINIEVLLGKNYLSDIVSKATSAAIYIDAIKTIEHDNSIIYTLTLKVKNKDELNKFINVLNNQSYIKKIVERMNF